MDPFTSASENRRDAPLDSTHRQALINVALSSIENGMVNREAVHPDPLAYALPLRELRSSFVTIFIDGDLRGCIGSLKAVIPLVSDVSKNAFRSAFEDPRFSPLQPEEFPRIEISISILSSPEPLSFRSEEDLISQLRPGLDGLILEAAGHKGTFLPDLWEILDDPQKFLVELKKKAGLSKDYWSPSLKVQRYTTQTIKGKKKGT